MATRLKPVCAILLLAGAGLLQACASGPTLPPLEAADPLLAEERESRLAYYERVQAAHDQLAISPAMASRTRLAFQYEAHQTLPIGPDPYGRLQRLSPDTAHAWWAMQGIAALDGIDLEVISGFRSLDRQTWLIAYRVYNGEDIADIATRIALPGYSEHHSGCAVDLVTPDQPTLSQDFAETEAYQWLRLHAGLFGFTESYPPGNDQGIIAEPWHWYYRDCDTQPDSGTGIAPVA